MAIVTARPPALPRALVRLLVRGDAREVIVGDLDEEFAELVAAGTPASAAARHYWRQALASIGACRRATAEMKRARALETADTPETTSSLFQGLGLDSRQVFRTLWRSKGYATIAVLSLAIGIGANTAIFGLVRQLLVDPLPVERPDELGLPYWTESPGTNLSVMQRASGGYRDPANGVNYRSNYSYPQYQALRSAASAPATVAAFNFIRQLAASVDGQTPISGSGMLVSGNFFATLTGLHVVVRADVPAATLRTPIVKAVAEVDPTLPVIDFKTQTDQIDQMVGKERTFAGLLTFFGGFALLLACLGLHGVTS